MTAASPDQPVDRPADGPLDVRRPAGGPGRTGARLVVAALGAALAPTAMAVGLPHGFGPAVCLVVATALLALVVGVQAHRLGVPRAEVTAATGYASGVLLSLVLALVLVGATDETPAAAALLTALPVVALATPVSVRMAEGTPWEPDPDAGTRIGRAGCVLLVAAVLGGVALPLTAPAQERAEHLADLAVQVTATAAPLRLPDLAPYEPYDVNVGRTLDGAPYVRVTYADTETDNRWLYVELHVVGDACQVLGGDPNDCTTGPGEDSSVVQDGSEVEVGVDVGSGVVVVSGERLDVAAVVEAVEAAESVDGRTVAGVCDVRLGDDGGAFCDSPD